MVTRHDWKLTLMRHDERTGRTKVVAVVDGLEVVRWAADTLRRRNRARR